MLHTGMQCHWIEQVFSYTTLFYHIATTSGYAFKSVALKVMSPISIAVLFLNLENNSYGEQVIVPLQHFPVTKIKSCLFVSINVF